MVFPTLGLTFVIVGALLLVVTFLVPVVAPLTAWGALILLAGLAILMFHWFRPRPRT